MTNAEPDAAVDADAADAAVAVASQPQLHRMVSTAIVIAAGAALVFEQSPLNEIIRTNAGFSVLERTGSAVGVGLIVALLTIVIELVPALLITLGLHTSGGAVDRLKARMGRRSAEASTEGEPAATKRLGRLGTDLAVALGLGAGLVTMRRHVADPAPTARKDIVVSCQATAVIAIVSGMIGYLVGGGLANADRIGLGTPARWIIDYGTNTWFWIGLIAVGYGGALIVRSARRRFAGGPT